MTTDTAVTAPARSGSGARTGADAASHAVGWGPLAVVLIGTFVFVLDFFIVNVALPAIQTGLSAGSGIVEWVVAGYGLTTAVSLITGGRLGDRYGRRRMFAVGLAGFVVTSALCALAPTGGILVAARLLQGLTAGLLAPNVLSIIGVVYPGARQARAISVYGMVMGLAATAGQLIGGVLVQADVFGLGWRSIFWINVPIGLAALAFVRIIPESRADRPGRIDLGGMLLVTAVVTAVVLPLMEGREHGWPAWTWTCLALAVPLTVAFGRLQLRARRGKDPLIDLRVLARRGPAVGLTVQLLFWCQQAASYLFLALFLQQGRGQSPIESGLMFAVLAAGYLMTSSPAPQLTARFGRNVILCGALLAAIGDIVLAVAVQHDGGSVLLLLPGLFVIGAGQGLCITPLTSTVLSFATAHSVGTISGTLSTVQQIGNAVGVGVIGVVFFGAVEHGYAVAFDRTLVLMAVLLAVVGALTRVMGSSKRQPAAAVGNERQGS